jgi:hypothetical protein
MRLSIALASELSEFGTCVENAYPGYEAVIDHALPPTRFLWGGIVKTWGIVKTNEVLVSFNLLFLCFFGPSTMFSLIIGIDTYQSEDINDLRGAVADARAFAAYLENLGVPQDHVRILKNESATRTAILENLRSLANDPRIQRGDPIVIYYAGHGSEAVAPPGWEAGGRLGNANIQVTMPHDVFCQSGDKSVDPIPDRTLGALLDVISQNKGNNIVSYHEIPTSHV